MPIIAQCENCQTKIKAPDSAHGKKYRCKKCGTPNIVPEPLAEESGAGFLDALDVASSMANETAKNTPALRPVSRTGGKGGGKKQGGVDQLMRGLQVFLFGMVMGVLVGFVSFVLVMKIYSLLGTSFVNAPSVAKYLSFGVPFLIFLTIPFCEPNVRRYIKTGTR